MDNVFIDFLNDSDGKASPVSNSHRQAYSDRTALLMALLSNLAYTKFNPPPNLHKIIQENIHNILSEKQPWLSKRKLSKIKSFFSLMTYDHLKEMEYLKNTLNKMDITLVKTFDTEGTQAILCSYNNKYLILAFRGTEKESFKDIKTDANAIMKNCETGGKVHSGFDKAYRKVHDDICEALENFNQNQDNKLPLYITGHSLGGALATIATKHLESIYQNGVAACYTFGSPRVAGPIWISTIKTPIYRVVNAADSVTMLPPSWEVISSISWLIEFLPWSIGKNLAKTLSEKFGGYLHVGDMRYLSNCTGGNYNNVQLLPHVSFFWKVRNWNKWSILWKKFLKDHSMRIYCEKLLVIAKRRNP